MTTPDMTQAPYGTHARHIPIWMYVQDQGTNGVAIVGASRSTDLRYESDKTHQLIVGELIVRPHFVVASDIFAGYGLGGLAKADHQQFINAEDAVIICDPMDQVRQYRTS